MIAGGIVARIRAPCLEAAQGGGGAQDTPPEDVRMAVGKMRAEAMASMNPELEDYVACLTDLATQEFGLTGEMA